MVSIDTGSNCVADEPPTLRSRASEGDYYVGYSGRAPDGGVDIARAAHRALGRVERGRGSATCPTFHAVRFAIQAPAIPYWALENGLPAIIASRR